MLEGIDKLKDYLRSESAINTDMAASIRSEPSTPKRASARQAHPGTFSVHARQRDKGPMESSHSWYYSSAAQLSERLLDGIGSELQELDSHENTDGTFVASPEALLISGGSNERLAALPSLGRQPSEEHCGSVFGVADGFQNARAPMHLAHSPTKSSGSSLACTAASTGCDTSAIIAMYSDDFDLATDVESSSVATSICSTGDRKVPDPACGGSSKNNYCSVGGTAEDSGSYLDNADVARLLGCIPPQGIFRERQNTADLQTEQRLVSPQPRRNEYFANVQIQAKQELDTARKRHQKQLAELEKDFERRLKAEQQRHAHEVNQREQTAQTQTAELQSCLDSMRAERNDLQAMLEEYVTTSSILLEQKEAESSGLSRELGRLTLDRQRMQEQLDESAKCVSALEAESAESLERANSLAAANAIFEHTAAGLRSDVLVAEERSTKIKAHAEDMLAKANAEIARLQNVAFAAQQDAAAACDRAVKADALAKSLQIQLNSAKRQNKEFLSLCKRFESSIA